MLAPQMLDVYSVILLSNRNHGQVIETVTDCFRKSHLNLMAQAKDRQMLVSYLHFDCCYLFGNLVRVHMNHSSQIGRVEATNSYEMYCPIIKIIVNIKLT